MLNFYNTTGGSTISPSGNKEECIAIKKDYSRLKSIVKTRVVGYINDDNLREMIKRIPIYCLRNEMVASLIEAYNILPRMYCVKSIPATDDELTSFHSSSYIEFLKELECDTNTRNIRDSTCKEEEFGLEYDCPVLKNQYEFVCTIAGGTLTAARLLRSMTVQVAINWCGGWHHAQRDEAEGFCYVNDIVIGIEELRKEFPRILYIDFDIHHGNGVQNAYSYTKRVFTLSFHKFEPGFYPATGALTEIGEGIGRHYSVNVPLSEGLTDEDLCMLFDRIVPEIRTRYRPEAVVVQCGADCLTGDPLGGFNLTPRSLGYCVTNILTWQLPTLVLGGGGYNKANTARCWTYLTGLICDMELPDDIPEHEYFSEYGPGFDLEISPGNMANSNNNLQQIIETILYNIEKINEDESTSLSKKRRID